MPIRRCTRSGLKIPGCLLALILLFASPLAAEREFHVAPSGNDNNPGTPDAPFATLEAARDAIRTLKTSGSLSEAVHVIVAGGRYQRQRPFVLTPGDSGSALTPVTYTAAQGSRPVLDSGREIGGWKKDPSGLWTTRIPEVAAGSWRFEQLFVNGRRATRARTPNKFYFYIQDLHEEVLEAGAGRYPLRARQTVGMRPGDFRLLARLEPDELADVNLMVYHKWDHTRRFIEKLDHQQHALVTRGQGMKPWNPWSRNSRYHLENFRGALDAPGEWFLARDGMLYYHPLPGEQIETTRVFAPVARQALLIQGDAAGGKWVQHVTLQGFTFRHTQSLTPAGGFEAAQAAAPVEAVVMVDGARNITIRDCELAHLGIYGVWFRKGCRNCILQHCYLHDLGAGGVRIGEGSIPANDDEQTIHITLDNNIIRGGGRIFPCAVGVWIGQSPDNYVTHNEIADLYYTGISVGWRWGYGASLAKRNRIAFNHVHHIGQGVLTDMGGIYTLGPSEGTTVANNVFHDIYAYSYGGWGLYTDEGSSNILFENNLVYRVKTGGFHQHYGRENIVRNNILALSELQQLQATRVEQHLSFTLENNIIYFDSGALLAGKWNGLNFRSRNNCFWNASGEAIRFAGKSLGQWQADGHETGSIIADPKFKNPASHDFQVADDSPVLGLGFKPFDYSKAGVYGDPRWIRTAAEAVFPPLERAPGPPPLSIHDDFEREKAGQPPTGVELHVENRGDSILVTDETAATGRQSLKITDAAGLAQVYNPHYVYSSMNYGEGRVHNSFDLRVEQATFLQFEWRDYKTRPPYITGPRLSVRGGTLQLPGQAAVDIPTGSWIHFEIIADLSRADGSRWALRVTPAGGKPRIVRNLPFVDPACHKLNWIGFISNATSRTAFYLDNFSLHP